jgi:putative hemin transport protein
MEKESDLEEYHQLVARYRHEDQTTELEVSESIPSKETELPDDQINRASFQNGWVALKDTHEFFGLMKAHKVTRTQALRLAPSKEFARKVKNDTLRKALFLAAENEVPIMVFVGNTGVIQIHTGKVTNIVEHGPWINVLDPDFNLHVRENAIHETWIVRKPTEDGLVTSLELFNEKGVLICTLFGERKPGNPELEAWRILVSQL